MRSLDIHKTVKRIVSNHEKAIVDSLYVDGMIVEGQFGIGSSTIKLGGKLLIEEIQNSEEFLLAIIDKIDTVDNLKFEIGYVDGSFENDYNHFYFIKINNHENFAGDLTAKDFAIRIFSKI